MMIKTFVVFVLTCGMVPLYAADAGLSLKGSLMPTLAVYYYDGTDDIDFSGTNQLRLSFRNRNRGHAKVELSFDVTQYYGAAADAYLGTAAAGLSVLDSLADSLAALLDDFQPVSLDLRTMYVALYTRYADVSIGRQIINYGRGMVFSPVDVYSEVDITDLDFRRSGTDVVRVQVPLGAVAGADLVTQLTGAAPTTALRLFGNVAGWDIAAVGMYRDKAYESMAGITFKGDLVAGIYGELVQKGITPDDPGYFAGMLGADYSVHNKWFFTAEYLYRDRPEAGSGLDALLYGRHNVFTAATFQANELLGLSVSSLLNPEDEKAFGTLQVIYSLFQNTDLVSYLRWYQLNLDPALDGLVPDLEIAAQAAVKF